MAKNSSQKSSNVKSADSKTGSSGNIVSRFLIKLFGGLNMSWPVAIIYSILIGLYTAVVAALVPDGNSFHDIAVTFEAWILLALIVVLNCKKPLEAALKTFVFFLISQPLVYLFQILFFKAPWSLMGYYDFWFKLTLLIFPAAFLAWFTKKKAWWAGIIMSGANAILVLMLVDYILGLSEHFPNHLLSAIYCILMIFVDIFVILKDKAAKIICSIVTAVLIIICFAFGYKGEEYAITLDSSFLDKEGIVFEGEPYVSYWSATESGCTGSVEITEDNGSYNYVFNGKGNCNYQFELRDDADNLVVYRYYRDNNSKELVLKRDF